MCIRRRRGSASYSYWTFGDIFEERGVPFTPFHGGFGLVANGGIPKPTFWVFKFYKDLNGTCVCKEEDLVVTEGDDGIYRGIVWNAARQRTGRELEITVSFPAKDGQDYVVVTKTVDEETCNPLRMWHDLGEPSSPDQRQKELILACARPFVSSGRAKASGEQVEFSLSVKEHGVIYFELQPVETTSDRGYDYNRVMQFD